MPSREYPDRRDFAPAHVCDPLASGRRQNDTDGEIAAVWRRDPIGRRSQGARRRARSDWMAIERERGISVSSAVMSFEREGLAFTARHAGPPGFQRTGISAGAPIGSAER